MKVTEIHACRACGETALESVLDLGSLCISDFVAEGQQGDRAPLELVRCSECMLVQLRHSVNRERLYSHYTYRSSMNESMVNALQDVVDEAVARHPLLPGDTVLDIGCNDGTLLDMYAEFGVWTLGYEPSNLAWIARDKGHQVRTDYFPDPVRQPAKPKPGIITSCACFYDVGDPGAFVEGIKEWLAPDGIWINQMSDLSMMLNANAFDNVCHEHLTYWGYHPFHRLCREHGLRISGMSLNNVNGGSARYIVEHDPHPLPASTQGKIDMGRGPIDAFSRRVQTLRLETQWLLKDLKDRGKLVLGYGASTKGNTLLQYYGLDDGLLPAIADRNPEKVGLRTVGTNIPIVSEAEARERQPDYFFVLPWAEHFVEAFKIREAEFLARGGLFIIPLPTLRIEGSERLTASEEIVQREGHHQSVPSSSAQRLMASETR